MTPTAGGAAREEIEIKLPCRDPSSMRARLVELSAARVRELHFEANDLYDDADGRLAKRGCTLRLRRTEERNTLTFKGPARFVAGIKTREERETAIEDYEEMEAILRGLGLVRRFRYEKRREEWLFESCVLALDETPIGDFIEVEGDPTAIRRVLSALEIDSAARQIGPPSTPITQQVVASGKPHERRLGGLGRLLSQSTGHRQDRQHGSQTPARHTSVWSLLLHKFPALGSSRGSAVTVLCVGLR